MFMAAISGSALADLAAIGSVMIPVMKREGYSPAFCVAVTSCAAMMAPIIPPSVIAVIYGSVTGVSIGALFLGGVIPGVLAGISMMGITWFLAPRAGGRPLPRATTGEAITATLRAHPGRGDAGPDHRRHPVGRLHADRGRCRGGALRPAVRADHAPPFGSARSTATSPMPRPPPRRR